MSQQPVYIIDGARTPFLKARNAPGPFSAGDLATAAGLTVLMRMSRAINGSVCDTDHAITAPLERS